MPVIGTTLFNTRLIRALRQYFESPIFPDGNIFYWDPKLPRPKQMILGSVAVPYSREKLEQLASLLVDNVVNQVKNESILG